MPLVPCPLPTLRRRRPPRRSTASSRLRPPACSARKAARQMHSPTPAPRLHSRRKHRTIRGLCKPPRRPPLPRSSAPLPMRHRRQRLRQRQRGQLPQERRRPQKRARHRQPSPVLPARQRLPLRQPAYPARQASPQPAKTCPGLTTLQRLNTSRSARKWQHPRNRPPRSHSAPPQPHRHRVRRNSARPRRHRPAARRRSRALQMRRPAAPRLPPWATTFQLTMTSRWTSRQPGLTTTSLPRQPQHAHRSQAR